MELLFYLEFMSAFISPAVLISIFIYGPIFLHTYWYPIIYIIGQLLIGIVTGLDYKFRDPTSRFWMYKPIMNLISALILPWVLFPAIKDFKKNGWLTR
jgi:hyaluronan synthase